MQPQIQEVFEIMKVPAGRGDIQGRGRAGPLPGGAAAQAYGEQLVHRLAESCRPVALAYRAAPLQPVRQRDDRR